MKNLMEEHKKRFGCDKPIIGCLHMRALPGTPMWDSNFTIDDQIKSLKEQAHILIELGFDGAVFANEEDYPYVENVSPGVLAAYTRIVTEVSKELTIPFGVGIMNDPYSAISVAKAVGATFCRGFFAGSQVGNYGDIKKTPGDIWRYAKSIGAEDVAVYSSFEPHNGSSYDTRTTEEMFNTIYKDVPVAGYSMNGPKKNQEPADSMIAKCKALNPNIPISFNNGANPKNIKKMMDYCDMIVVGTTLKKDHYLFNPIDYNNAKEFIIAARS